MSRKKNICKNILRIVVILFFVVSIIENISALPRIECLTSSVQLNSGGTVNANIRVYNDGEFPGNINPLPIECDSGIYAVISPVTYPLDKLSSSPGIVTIGGSASGTDNYGTCQITIKDSNDPSLTDQCSIQVQVKATECKVPGNSQCSVDGREVLYCGQDGMFHNTPCTYGCEVVSSIKAKCKNSSSQGTNYTLSIIIIGMCIIVGFIILGLILRKKRKNNHKKSGSRY